MEDRKTPPKPRATTPGRIKPTDCLGRCDDCLHIGCISLDCKQCGGNMNKLPIYESDDSEDEDPDNTGLEDYRFCVECKSIAKNQVNCIVCLKEGDTIKMQKLPPSVEEDLMRHKTLPRCALVTYNRCQPCYHTAIYLSNQLRHEIIMKKCVRDVIREYECMVENDLAINVETNHGSKKARFKIDLSTVDISPQTLKSLASHHQNFCLCSICKWCMITGMIFDEV